MKILFQLGLSVLYSVWVCSLELTSWRTQKGSDLPPISVDASPVARNTFTLRWPTSRVFSSVRYRACHVHLKTIKKHKKSLSFCQKKSQNLVKILRRLNKRVKKLVLSIFFEQKRSNFRVQSKFWPWLRQNLSKFFVRGKKVLKNVTFLCTM